MLTSFFIIHSRPYFRLYKSNKYFRIFSKSIQYLSFSQYLPIFIWQIFYIANNILLHYIFQWNIMILTNIGGVTKVRAYFSKIHRCLYWLGNLFTYLHSKLMSGNDRHSSFQLTFVPLCLQHNFSCMPTSSCSHFVILTTLKCILIKILVWFSTLA